MRTMRSRLANKIITRPARYSRGKRIAALRRLGWIYWEWKFAGGSVLIHQR